MTINFASTFRLSAIALALFQPAVAAAQEPSSSIPLPATQYKLSRLAPGQTSGQAVFPVDAANNMTVQIMSNDGGLTTSILGPAAQLINPATIDAFGGVYSATDAAAADSPLLLSGPRTGFQYLYVFPSLGAGNYTVRFSTASTSEVAVITQITTNSRLGVALIATDPTLVLGNAEVLTAAVFDGDTPVSGASVAITVVPPSGPPLHLTLRDDGGPADAAAGDGLYSAELTPSVTGSFLASALITGTSASGASFTRHGAASFAVVPKTSVLPGAFSDNGVDDNGDGLFDRVRLLVHKVTTKPGNYRAFVHLSTPSGQKIVRSGEADLLVSSQGISVDFEAEALVQLHENGPYNVDLIELVFLDVAGATPADQVANAGQTRAYLLSQFQRPPLALTAVTSEQGFDDNGNGKFDRLLVSLQVDVLRAGFYSWGYKLTDQLAHEIDFGSGSGFFNAGLNLLTVTFEGSKIGASRANGPYQLRDLLVQGSGTSLVVSDVGRTQAYRNGQFEGGVSNQPPVSDAGADRTIEATGASTPVTLNGSASSDPDGDTLTYEWRDVSGQLVATTATAVVPLPLGARTFTLTVNDGHGGTSSDTVTMTIRDTTAPAISAVTPSANLLWPPNHKMVPVSLTATASDLVDAHPVCRIAGVSSSEPTDGLGDGDTAPDWEVLTGLSLNLRAERAGIGTGRVYRITVMCTDGSGNVAAASATVTVPHDR
jgi:hypothetical protein